MQASGGTHGCELEAGMRRLLYTRIRAHNYTQNSACSLSPSAIWLMGVFFTCFCLLFFKKLCFILVCFLFSFLIRFHGLFTFPVFVFHSSF
ncbi:hypothetical protein B0T19DRAFT_110515 [Cercophora scortea]|uniref:Uncharacterized protein n=1 Tax=Cercophora scortea TaxID=314031 RepID=A0AAE0MHI6_9PEZI|nr:hypothetical protein B0T19DRAFT_110515 [Cercophora scortea]